MKMIGRYYLLCDACNWEFTGFALPGTVSSRRRRTKQGQEKEEVESQHSEDSAVDGVKRKKRVRVRS